MHLLNVNHKSLPCPHCEEKGGLSYEELPNSRLVYTIEEGEMEGEHTPSTTVRRAATTAATATASSCCS